LAAAALALAANVGTASAGTILFDRNFSSIGFTPSTAGFTPTGDTVASVTNATGLSGNGIGVTITNNSYAGTNVAGVGILDNLLTYNPGTSGALLSFNAQVDMKITGATSNFILLLRQGSNFYQYIANANIGPFDWTHFTASNLTAASFSQICLIACASNNNGGLFDKVLTSGTTPLDLTNGGLITFGLVAISAPTSGNQSVITFDNLEIDLNNAPLPSTWAMLLGGFAFLGFVAYRSRRNAGSTTAFA